MKTLIAGLTTAVVVSGLVMASETAVAEQPTTALTHVFIDRQADLEKDVEATENLGEDDPGWNCRTMGNQICGQIIGNVWLKEYWGR